MRKLIEKRKPSEEFAELEKRCITPMYWLLAGLFIYMILLMAFLKDDWLQMLTVKRAASAYEMIKGIYISSVAVVMAAFIGTFYGHDENLTELKAEIEDK